MAEAKVIIRAEDRTQAAFRSVQKSLGDLQRSIVGLVSAGAIGGYLKSIVDMGDRLQETSQKLGVSVEKLSAYAYAAKVAGSSSDQVSQALVKLATNMQEAGLNKGGEMARTFAALGIGVKDANGHLRATDEVFEDLARKFANAEDGPGKTAAAVKLLGRSGADLIPLLNSLEDTTAEARRTGQVIGAQFAEKADQFNDSIARIQGALRGFIANAGESSAIMDGFLTAIKAVTSIGIAAADTIQNLGLAIGSLAAAGVQAAQLNFGEAKKIIELSSRDMEENTRRANEAIARLWEEQPKKAEETAKKIKKTVIQITEGNFGIDPEKFDRLLADLARETEQAQLELVTDEKEKAARRIAIASMEALKKAEFEKLSVEQRKQYIEAFTKFSEAKTAEEMHKARTDMQKLNDEWQNTALQMEKATTKWANSATDALTEFVMTGKASFTDFANSVIRDLVRMYVQKQITGPLFAAAESGGFFSGLGKLLGFAEGGNPPVGVPSIVGERGPELFVPKTAGTIVPNDRLATGGDTYYIDARGADQAGLARLETLIMRLNGSIEHRAVAAVMDARARGGRFAATFSA